MSKRKLAWIVVAVVTVAALAGLLWSLLGTSRLAFTEPDIQARLNKELPKTVKDVTVERVTVHLADRRLALRVDLHGALLRQPLTAVVSARGVPRYETQSGELYFDADDVKIDQLTIAGRSIGGADDPAGARLGEAAGPGVRRVAETAMQVYLATQPVYRFKENFRGVVLRAALKDVTIEQNAVMVTFSIWNVTTTVAILAVVLIGVLSAVYLLVRYPRWGRRTVGSPPPARSHSRRSSSAS
jgi:hypothetical protein